MSQDPIFHNFDEAPTHVAPFSHAVEVDGWIQLTGQMPTDPDDDSAPLPEGIQAQTHRVMDNLIIVLEGLGLDHSNLIQMQYIMEQMIMPQGLLACLNLLTNFKQIENS